MKLFRSKAAAPASLVGAELAIRIVGPVLTLFVVRELGPNEFGTYASALAVINLLSILPMLGTEPTVMKWAASGTRGRQALTLGTTAAVFLSSLAAILLVIWIQFTDDSHVSRVALLMSGYILASGFNSVVSGFFQGKGRFGAAALYSTAAGGIMWAAIAAVLVLGASAATIGAAQGASFLVVSAGVLLALLLAPSGFVAFRREEASSFVTDMGGFAATTTLYQLYNRGDSALLALMSTPLQVGAYTIAYRGIELVFTFPTLVFTKVFFSKFVAWRVEAPERIRLYMGLTTNLLGALAGILTLLVALVGPRAVEIVLGSSQSEAGALLRYLAWVVPFQFLSAPTGSLVLSQGHIRHRLTVQGSALATNLVLNIVLIPGIGARGAAVAMIVSSVVHYFGSTALASRLTPSLTTGRAEELAAFVPSALAITAIAVEEYVGAAAGVLVSLAAVTLIGWWWWRRTPANHRAELRRMMSSDRGAESSAD